MKICINNNKYKDINNNKWINILIIRYKWLLNIFIHKLILIDIKINEWI